MPKPKRRQPRSFHKGARVGTRTLRTGSTRPDELEMADKLRPSPLLLAKMRREPASIMDTLDTADMTLAEVSIAVLKTLGRPATPKEIHALVIVGRPDANYDAVNRGLQRAIHRPETGVRRKDGIYYTVDGQGSTVEPEDTVATSKGDPKRYIKNDLMEYLSKRPGVTVYAGDVAKDLNVDEQKVRNGIGNIRQAHGDDFPITTEIPARAWMYRPKGTATADAPTDTLFKLIGGPTKDGSYILEREDGTLYLAKEM